MWKAWLTSCRSEPHRFIRGKGVEQADAKSASKSWSLGSPGVDQVIVCSPYARAAPVTKHDAFTYDPPG
jgi:hypothetical protein